MKHTIFLVCGLILFGLACTPAQAFKGEVVDDPIKPILVGQNWDGKRFDLAENTGKVTLVFFGYTFCPDVCPFTLAKMKQLYDRLGDRADDLKVIFASVDPHRDSVEKLSNYVPNFEQRFLGLHLTFNEIEIAKESFGITVQYGQPKDGPGTDSFYYVDHSGTFFLLDREGTLRVKLPPNASLDDLEADVRSLLSS